MPIAVDADIHSFIDLLEQEPFDQNSLKRYALKNEDIVGVVEVSIRIKIWCGMPLICNPFLHLLRTILCENKPGYSKKQKFTKAYKAWNTKKN